MALLTWNAAAFHLKDREAWIGGTERQKRRRLTLVVNNSRFLIRTEGRVPNLASRVMRLCLDRLAVDWLGRHGHEVLVAESFVDRQLFRGTGYKAGGWTLLGQTQGYRRARQDYYVAHERPKPLWVRELRPGARTILRGRNLPAALKVLEAGPVPDCPQNAEEVGRMRGFFAGLPNWRTKQGDYALASLVTIAVGAALCGVPPSTTGYAPGVLRFHGAPKWPKGLRSRIRLQSRLVTPMRNQRCGEANVDTYCLVAGIGYTFRSEERAHELPVSFERVEVALHALFE